MQFTLLITFSQYIYIYIYFFFFMVKQVRLWLRFSSSYFFWNMLRKLYYRLCFGISCYFGIGNIFIMSYVSIFVGQIKLAKLMFLCMLVVDSRLIGRTWGLEFIGSKFRI